MITFNFNAGDLQRIAGKLVKLKQNAQVDNGPIFNIAWKYTTAYHRTIVSAMGKVSGEMGGDPGITYFGESESIEWAPLSPATLEFKEELGLSMNIWRATGDTEAAVKLRTIKLDKGSREFVAGIGRATNQIEYLRALEVEYGGGSGWDPSISNRPAKINVVGDYGEGRAGGYPGRALFTLTNELFKRNHGKIAAEVMRALQEGVNWGSR